MQNAKKGDWVQIHSIVLKAGERAPQVPEDTQAVPLELWVKGILQNDASFGDKVTIETVTGRIAEGELVAVNPGYSHNYGSYIPELQKIDKQLKDILYGGLK